MVYSYASMQVWMCLNSKERESLKEGEMEAREVRADSTAHGFQTHKWNQEPEFWHQSRWGWAAGMDPLHKTGIFKSGNHQQKQDKEHDTCWAAMKKHGLPGTTHVWDPGLQALSRTTEGPRLPQKQPGNALKDIFITITNQTHPDGETHKDEFTIWDHKPPKSQIHESPWNRRELGMMEWAEQDYRTAGLRGHTQHHVCQTTQGKRL